MTRWVTVGRVGRPHGLDGFFVVEVPSDDPHRLAPGACVYVRREATTVVAFKRASRRVAIRLDRPVDRGELLEVPASALPPTQEGEYYAFQLVGLAVEDESGRRLGTVVEVAPGIANDVLELDSGQSLPLVDDCVCEIDLEAGRIRIAPGFSELLDD